jgi:hypothetical protein
MMQYPILCLALLLISCSDDDGNDEIIIREKRIAEISTEVDEMIADKSCNGIDDCASIGWGAKPCGGPWSYLVYAPSNVDVPQLEALTEEYNRLEQEINQIKGLASDCAFVTAPELECVGNVCKAKE